jgi:hypothetical protein
MLQRALRDAHLRLDPGHQGIGGEHGRFEVGLAATARRDLVAQLGGRPGRAGVQGPDQEREHAEPDHDMRAQTRPGPLGGSRHRSPLPLRLIETFVAGGTDGTRIRLEAPAS